MVEDNDNSEPKLVPATTGTELALDGLAIISSMAPWIGAPMSNILSGLSVGRKMSRINEVLSGLAADLESFKSKASEEYVRTEDFQDLVEHTLKRVAEERHEEKRRIYRAFLVDAIESPGKPYDDKMKLLRILEEIQPDHVRVLRALDVEPAPDPPMMGSVSQTLEKRLPGISMPIVAELVRQLDDLRLTSVGQFGGMMTGRGAEDLRSRITPLGRGLIGFLKNNGRVASW